MKRLVKRFDQVIMQFILLAMRRLTVKIKLDWSLSDLSGGWHLHHNVLINFKLTITAR